MSGLQDYLIAKRDALLRRKQAAETRSVGGFEHMPVYPHNIRYTVHVTSSASDAELAELHQAVERVCPILNLLANPQEITGRIEHALPASGQAPAAVGAR